MANAEVIRFFKRKSQTGFDSPTYLGAEQRFVGALRNSGVNNLEEQFILGTDTYTEKYIDENGNSVIETSYHINDSAHSTADYYKLISISYDSGFQNENFFFDEGAINFPNDSDEVIFGNGGDMFPDIKTLYGNIGSTAEKKIETLRFNDKGKELRIFPSSFTIIRKDELHYINEAEDILVLTKLVGRKYLEDGAREIIRENIVNHLLN